VLQRVKEERNILQTVKRRKANWIGHILCRNCRLKNVNARQNGRIEVTGSRGRRRKQLMDGLKAKTGYWKLKEGALDRAVWRTGFGRGCGTAGGKAEERSERAILFVLIRTGGA
jgi:hypothetical protein